MMKVLIIKTSALGDIVQALPVAHYLKKCHPGTQVDWVVEEENSALVHAYPYVDRVFTVSTRAWRKGKNLSSLWKVKRSLAKGNYDLLFDLQANTKSGVITWLTKAKKKVGYSRKFVAEWPNLLATNTRFSIPVDQNIRQDYLNLIQNYFKDNEPFVPPPTLLNINETEHAFIDQLLHDERRPKIMICHGSAWKHKQADFDTIKRVMHKLHQDYKGVFYFIWGTPEEKELAIRYQLSLPEATTLLPKLPLNVLQNLMDRMDFVLGMDSLPLHLAALTSSKTIGIFGPSSMEKYRPQGEGHQAIQGACPYNYTFQKRCPHLRNCATGACMKELKADDILALF